MKDRMKKNYIQNQLKVLLFIFLFCDIECQYVPLDNQMEEVFRKYLGICKNGQLLPGREMKKSLNPKISIVIPLYNEEKNLIPVIRSIQNQSLQEIEIVCVNDNSKDKTLSVLKDLQKQDPRITIITNRKNRGVTYNRIYGALKSKGEYITYIDADDALCNMNIFQNAYSIANSQNEIIDIVHYQTCGTDLDKNGNFNKFYLFATFNPYNFNKIIRKPEIGDNYFQKKKNITGSGFVFDKIYSRALIKRVANYIGEDVWNQNLVFCDDFLLAFAVMKCADSIINIGEVGYFHLIDTSTSTTSNVWKIDGNRLANPDKSNRKIGDYMIVIERVLQLTENEPESCEFRDYALRQLGENDYLKAIARSIHYDKYLSLCEKVYKWKYIDKETKEKTREFIKKVLSYRIDSTKKFAHLLKEEKEKNEDKEYDEIDELL